MNVDVRRRSAVRIVLIGRPGEVAPSKSRQAPESSTEKPGKTINNRPIKVYAGWKRRFATPLDFGTLSASRKDKYGGSPPEYKKMRIDNNNPGTIAPGSTTRTNETKATSSGAKGSTAPSSSSDSDGLQLSRFAGTLSQVMQSDSTSRAQNIAQLAVAVRSGTYQVDAAAVSSAIVDHAISTGQNG